MGAVATGFAPVVVAFLGLLGLVGLTAALGATVSLASTLSGFAFFAAAVTLGCLGAFVTGLGVGLGVGGVLALTIRPPRTTWLHPSPSSICSAEGSGCRVFGGAGLQLIGFHNRGGKCLLLVRTDSLYTADYVSSLKG